MNSSKIYLTKNIDSEFMVPDKQNGYAATLELNTSIYRIWS